MHRHQPEPVLVVLLLAVLAALLVAGCAPPDTQLGQYRRTTAEGETLDVTVARGRGHGGDLAAAPATIHPDGRVEFGASSLRGATKKILNLNVLVWLGAALVVAGVVAAVLLRLPLLGAALGIAGVGLVGLAAYPQIAGWAAAAGVVVAGGAAVHALWRYRRTRHAQEQLVEGVQAARIHLPASMRSLVDRDLAAATDDTTRSEVAREKRRRRLPSARAGVAGLLVCVILSGCAARPAPVPQDEPDTHAARTTPPAASDAHSAPATPHAAVPLRPYRVVEPGVVVVIDRDGRVLRMRLPRGVELFLRAIPAAPDDPAPETRDPVPVPAPPGCARQA